VVRGNGCASFDRKAVARGCCRTQRQAVALVADPSMVALHLFMRLLREADVARGCCTDRGLLLPMVALYSHCRCCLSFDGCALSLFISLISLCAYNALIWAPILLHLAGLILASMFLLTLYGFLECHLPLPLNI
jgi:hypothetical protein